MSRSRRLGNTSFFILKCHSWQRHHNVPDTKIVLDGDDAELADVVDVANLMVFFMLFMLLVILKIMMTLKLKFD